MGPVSFRQGKGEPGATQRGLAETLSLKLSKDSVSQLDNSLERHQRLVASKSKVGNEVVDWGIQRVSLDGVQGLKGTHL